jgi:hypothetical protein
VGFAGGAQAVEKGFAEGVAAHGIESGHAASATHGEAAAGDVALAFCAGRCLR